MVNEELQIRRRNTIIAEKRQLRVSNEVYQLVSFATQDRLRDILSNSNSIITIHWRVNLGQLVEISKQRLDCHKNDYRYTVTTNIAPRVLQYFGTMTSQEITQLVWQPQPSFAIL